MIHHTHYLFLQSHLALLLDRDTILRQIFRLMKVYAILLERMRTFTHISRGIDLPASLAFVI